VPRFADLSQGQRTSIGRLMNQGRKGMAARELAKATGCPLAWAELWVLHRGRPRRPSDRRLGCLAALETPCPYCGEPLRTPRAKQCRHCRRDWHDPAKVARLGGD
jgi:hypothetical protein